MHINAEAASAVDDPLELARFTSWEPSVDGSPRVGTSSLQLTGMHCAACAGIIEAALLQVPGVLDASVNAAAQRASVRWDSGQTRASALLKAVQQVGYGVSPDAAASARELRKQEQRSVMWRLFVGSFLAMQVMMMATPSYVANEGELAPDLAQLLNWGSWVLSIPVLLFGGWPFLHGAWQSIRARRIGMDVPVALGILVTFVVSSGATFEPTGLFGHEVYFDSLTMFVAFLWLGRWLEMKARHRAAESLEAALSDMPATAWLVDEHGVVTEVAVGRLQAGDRVRIPAGGVLPADGVLLSTAADVAEALLTGESQPVTKVAGDTVLAGSSNVVGPIEIQVHRVGADTRYEAIVALMRSALSQRPQAARLADRVAGPFLWVVLVLAVGAAAVWSTIDPSRAVWVAVSVLIVTCPCALSLATPATLVAATGGLAQRGVLLRNLDALQALSRVQRLFLDKTGTLTLNRPVLKDTRLVHQQGPLESEADALRAASQLAQWSSHPFSVALTDAAKRVAQSSVAQPALASVVEEPGKGLSARDGAGHLWQLGSGQWLGVVGKDENNTQDEGVWLARDSQRLASFSFTEGLRDDALQTVQRLKGQGLALTLLSGDQTQRAAQVAAQLGISDIAAGSDPESKLATLRQAQAAGEQVAMVGDGINDVPVMGAANVSIAMGHGALAAQQHADAVILSGKLSALLDLRLTAQRSMTIVRQNLVWAAVYNLVCIPLALAGWLPPWAAGLGMALSSVLVVANAQRAASGAD
jgi:P-type Cu2+ transporter